MGKNRSKDKTLILYTFVVLIVGLALRLYKFGYVMDMMQSDEMGIGYDAWCILHFGSDRYGNPHPVYLLNYGRGASVLYLYLCAFFMKFIGYGRVAIRFPALIGSAVLAFAGCFLTRELAEDAGKDKDKAGLIFALLYALSPYTYMASRFALDCNLMFGFSALFMLCLVKAYKSEKSFWYFIAGIFAGVTLYTYAVSYIVMPVMLLLSIIYMLWTRKVRLGQVIAFVLPLAVLACPLMLVQYVNMFDKEQFVLWKFTITKLPEYAGSEISFKDFAPNLVKVIKLTVISDGMDYNTSDTFMTFLPLSIPFAVVGTVLLIKDTVVAVVKRSAKGYVLVFFWLFAELLAGGLMKDPNANRMNGIYYPVMLVIVIGITAVLGLLKGNAEKLTAAALCLAYMVFFGFFLRYYFTDFDPQVTSSMCPEALEFIKSDESIAGKPVVTNIPPYLYDATRLPDPGTVNEASEYHGDDYCYADTDEAVKDNLYNVYGAAANYLVFRPGDELKEVFASLDYNEKQFGSFYLYY